MTIFIARLGANSEYGFKIIIALSTLRQLKVILRFLVLGCIHSLFHLLRHALFKVLLFICAWVVIHAVGGCQYICCEAVW